MSKNSKLTGINLSGLNEFERIMAFNEWAKNNLNCYHDLNEAKNHLPFRINLSSCPIVGDITAIYTTKTDDKTLICLFEHSVNGVALTINRNNFCGNYRSKKSINKIEKNLFISIYTLNGPKKYTCCRYSGKKLKLLSQLSEQKNSVGIPK